MLTNCSIEDQIAKEKKATAAYKKWKHMVKQKRQDNIDEFAKAVDEELKKKETV